MGSLACKAEALAKDPTFDPCQFRAQTPGMHSRVGMTRATDGIVPGLAGGLRSHVPQQKFKGLAAFVLWAAVALSFSRQIPSGWWDVKTD